MISIETLFLRHTNLDGSGSSYSVGKHIDEFAAAVQRLGNTELKINLSIGELMRVIHIKPRG